MRKNYLKMMKAIGNMSNREEIITSLCNCDNRYLIKAIDTKNRSIQFVPLECNENETYKDLTVYFTRKGRPEAIFFSSVNIFTYKMLEYFPLNDFSAKLKISRI